MAVKTKHKLLVIGGIVLFIVGIIGAIYAFYVLIPDPSDAAEATLAFDYDDDSESSMSQSVYLKKGDYDIWYEPIIFGIGGPTNVEIEDPDGDAIFNSMKILDTSDSISKNGRTYKKFGEFKADSSGDYNFTVFSTSTLYIVPSINLDLANGLGYTFVVLSVLGIIILLIGIITHFLQKSEKKKAKQQSETPPPPPQQPYYPYYYPYQYQQPPPPPPPPPPQSPPK
ncbi:hypothetical protein [[Eubacterium] cellulosolvens]